jgi:hypothetical protein
MTKNRLEVHEHCIISGPRANKTWCNKIVHSHEGGSDSHQHPDTGPASYTIDKDEWLRATGLRGGGRKKFTLSATGEQLPRVELEDWQREFEVIVGPPPPDFSGSGAGIAPVVRMILAFGMTCTVRAANDAA